MINGLDLFSGIAGNSLGLRRYIKTVAYCEADKHAQSVLLSRMADGGLAPAPIWDDITTLRGGLFDIPIDIIVGGFPCQDISVAGTGAGLAGKRSGLFFEVCRLVEEIQPAFVFLENVPAIRTRGLREVIRALTDLGYDCRWTRVSAQEVGAPHKRERWFLLGRNTDNQRQKKQVGSLQGGSNTNSRGICWDVADSFGSRDGAKSSSMVSKEEKRKSDSALSSRCSSAALSRQEHNQHRRELHTAYWQTEPDVGRVVNGLSFRMDRIKRLGNAVVPLQAKVAFERLMGLEGKINHVNGR